MSEIVEVDRRVAIVREFVARVFNGHDPERARDFFTADALWHGPSIAEVSGVDSIVGLLGAFIGALSDIRAEEQDVIASGDLVALRQVVTATQSGDMLGIPAIGSQLGAFSLPWAN